MARLILTLVHGLSSAIAASGYMELPFTEFHELVIWVEGTSENLGAVYFLHVN